MTDKYVCLWEVKGYVLSHIVEVEYRIVQTTVIYATYIGKKLRYGAHSSLLTDN